MKKTLRITSIILASLMTVSIVFGNFAAITAKADEISYRYVYSSYGNYPAFNNTSDLASYVKNYLDNSEQCNFYYDGTIGTSISEFVSDFTYDVLFAHNGVSDEGDYLKYNFSGASIGYSKFTRSGSTVYYITLKYFFYMTPAQEGELTANINSIVSSLNLNGKSDYVKALDIYKWITSNITYDYYNLYLSAEQRDILCFTSYNAVMKRTAVCQGIGTLYYRMLLQAGVDARVVVGGNHCWNIVKVNGQYYNCDATWDLGNNESNFQYFLQPTAGIFGSTHTMTSDVIYSQYAIATTKYVPSASDYTVTSVVDRTSVTNFVKRLYNVALGRDYDDSGLQNWVNTMVNGTSGGSVATSFISCEEFANRNLTNEQYVQVLYETFFNREADSAGFEVWMNYLNNGYSRSAVLKGFVGSQEWINLCNGYGIASGSQNGSIDSRDQITAFVNRLYSKALGRTADSDGLNNWVNALANKSASGSSVADGFLFSQEMNNRNLSNEEFVKVLYNVMLGREADSVGLASWVAQLESGASRKDIFNGFVGSQEFTNICNSYGIAR